MLTAIVRWSLEHRAAVVLLWATLLLLGVFSAARADLDAFPDFSPPRVNVQTEAPGYGAEDVEAFVTGPLEAAVGGTPRLETLRSRSVPGLSVIEITFKEGTDLYLARQLVSERLQRATPLLPDGVEAPALERLTAATGRLLVIGVTAAREGAQLASPLELRSACEKVLRARILAVPGVAGVTIFGGGQERLEASVRPEELSRRGIAWDEVVDAARRASAVSPAGFVDRSSQRLHFLVEGRALSPDELAMVPVRSSPDGGRVLLGDVALVRSSSGPLSGDAVLAWKRGKEARVENAVLLMVDKLPGANALATTLEVEKAIKAALPLMPPGTVVRP
ncbi:efflux RND transporter permease subunit, partial [bacterium]|nr:efflux RND transporter permease subunit [bacterium]